MQINQITPYRLHNASVISLQKPQQKKEGFSTSPVVSKNILPTTAQYLSFTGGYSLNLAETISRLDKFAEKDTSLYPKHIREWAEFILGTGNKSKFTLIDIHKQYYESLKSCKTLAEVKEKFPEFANVKSDRHVMFSQNSFGYDVKHGLLDAFDKDEDLSLQLLKLYYGEGFSLNDLKGYTNGKDIHYTMKKLEIPLQNRTYGEVLKLSDPEYNKRITSEMAYRRRLTLDKQAQEAGEPVYIPRGPLSPEHKEHISEALKKYYQENPERIYQQSERMKEFYRSNPDKADELRRVLTKAWGLSGADRIKKALSQFLKGKGIQNFNEFAPIDLSKAQSQAMKAFWGGNEWARKLFSKNMEYAWKKVKEENETFYRIRTLPTQIIRMAESKAGLKVGDLDVDTLYNPYTRDSKVSNPSEQVMMKITSVVDEFADIVASSYPVALYESISKLNKLDLRHKPKAFSEVLNLAKSIWNNNLQENGKSYKIQDIKEARADFVTLEQYAVELHCQEVLDLLHKTLDEQFARVAEHAKKK